MIGKQHQPPPGPRRLLTKQEVAAKLRVSVRTISRMMSAEDMPPPVWLGRNPRWKEGDVDAWIDDGCPSMQR